MRVSLTKDDDDNSPFHKRRRPNEDAVLQVIRASGETVTLSEDEWELDRERNRLYFITHQNDELETVHSFVQSDPPESAHIPMGTLTASDNTAEKTEQTARSPMNVVRYSVVTNTSNHPDNVHTFTAGVIELWLENDDRRFWPTGILDRLLP